MPDKAAKLLDELGVAADKRTMQEAGYGKDLTYGKVLESPKLMPPRLTRWLSLFPPVNGMQSWAKARGDGDEWASVPPKHRMRKIIDSLRTGETSKFKDT